jgi:hypothetical protein
MESITSIACARACYCPTSPFLGAWDHQVLFLLNQAKQSFKRVVEVAARHGQHIGRDAEGKHIKLCSQQGYAAARAETGGVHLMSYPLPDIINQDSN